MGHNIHFINFDGNIARNEIVDECNCYARKNSDAGGLYNGIRFFEAVMPSYDAAREFLEKHDRNDYDNLAVKYKPEPTEASSSLKRARESSGKAALARAELRKKTRNDFYGMKSKFVGCKQCGSKLSVEYLAKYFGTGDTMPFCPLCRTSLLSETAQNRLKASDERVKKAQAAERAELEKQNKKRDNTSVNWLVKIEFHS